MSVPPRLVRRYARALFEVARERNLEAEVGRDLASAASALEDPSVAFAFFDPTAKAEAKRRLVAERIAPSATDLFRRFANLLIERGREEVLRSAAGAYGAETDRAEGIIRGVAESALPLAEEDLRGLEGELGRAIGASVRLAPRVSADLVAGVRIALPGALLDATVPGFLRALRERLLSVPLPQG